VSDARPVTRNIALALALAATTALAACVQVPRVDEHRLAREAAGSARIRVYGARGPLSRRESQALLARVAVQAPDAGALERHLAVEQIIARNPLDAGNSVRVLRDGKQTFPAIFAAIAAARHFVDLEYYTIEDVRCNGRDLGALLARKSREGVRIRVIYDAFGSITTPPAFFARLRAAGVRVLEYNPINPLRAGSRFAPNRRDHRKILVADDSVAIVGGVNLSTTYESVPPLHHAIAAARGKPLASRPVWHDLDLEIRGPVVRELQTLFLEHWRRQHGPPLEQQDPVIPPAGRQIARVIGSSPTDLALRYYATVLSAVHSAASSIWMTAAYFVPTRQELRGLESAARRGVDVRILLPSHSDVPPMIAVQRSYYPQLLRSGVKIYERRDGIVHSKSMVIDDVWSLVGSSNFDQRSVLFNDEVDVVVLGRATAQQLRAAMVSDMRHARRITWHDVREESALERFKAWLLGWWRRLL
jgi:cardiolipin synthase